MKIFDCFMYNNENLILEIRLNTLSQYVDKFIIVEAKYDHQGNVKKKYKFDIENFSKFKHKIEYWQISNFPVDFNSWERENFQRNFILNGLLEANQDDYVIVSDIDEIPNLEDIDLIIKSKKKYTAFKQKMIYYKLNLQNLTEKEWYGSKMCKLKNLKSPQWLRNKKVKLYPFYRFDKINWNIINNGGWHFSNIMTPHDISKKIKSFAHSEFNKPEFTNIKNIKEKMKSKKDLFGRKFEFEKITQEKDLPEYINENQKKFSEFLLK